MPLVNLNNRIVSSKQANRIRYYTNLLIDASKSKKVFQKSTKKWYSFKVNLITLTLPSPQQHTDKEIHEKVFKEFIRAWKRSNPSLLYIYKAEVQDNGNLHYHLTTNSYIHHASLRNMWNYYCNKLGYIDRCSVSDPNSTDVHAVKNINNLAAYMVAYMSKKDVYDSVLKRYHNIMDKKLTKIDAPVCEIPKNYYKHLKRKVAIKVWDCSKTLMIGKCSMEIDSDEIMNEIRHYLATTDKLIKKDWCIVLPQDKKQRNAYKTISRVYSGHIKKLREFTETQPAEYYID